MAPIQSNEYSLLHIERISQYVPLPPTSLTTPLPALCAEIFSPLLLSYYAPAKGIVLAYEDVKLSEQPPKSSNNAQRARAARRARHRRTHDEESEEEADAEEEGGMVLLRQIDEYAAPFVWATASLLVWRPKENAYLDATIIHQSSTHITLSHLNSFPITILRAHLPSVWTYHQATANSKKKGWDGRIADEGGWWVDGEGEAVSAGTQMRVRIREWDARGSGVGKGRGILRIEGSLLSEGEEREAVAREKGKRGVGRSGGEVVQVD